MHVVLQTSPSVAHKYRVLLPNKRAVDFGRVDFRDYTDHGNPKIMRAHLITRGAVIPNEVQRRSGIPFPESFVLPRNEESYV